MVWLYSVLLYLFVCLFTYDLFNDAASNPDYMASNDRMMNDKEYRYYLCFDFRIIYNSTEFPSEISDCNIY
jgi:hypothetical protein